MYDLILYALDIAAIVFIYKVLKGHLRDRNKFEPIKHWPAAIGRGDSVECDGVVYTFDKGKIFKDPEALREYVATLR